MKPNRTDRKTVRNLQYLDQIERKQKMSRIIDPMGMPVGGNNQPQGPQFNPVLQMLWPMFAQAIHDELTNRIAKETPEAVVNYAWETANRAFNCMGFQFVFPMACQVIPASAIEPEKEDSTNE